MPGKFRSPIRFLTGGGLRSAARMALGGVLLAAAPLRAQTPVSPPTVSDAAPRLQSLRVTLRLFSAVPPSKALKLLFQKAHVKMRINPMDEAVLDGMAHGTWEDKPLETVLKDILRQFQPRLSYSIASDGAYVLFYKHAPAPAQVEVNAGDMGVINALALSPDNKLIACGDNNDHVTVWSHEGDVRYQREGQISSDAFSPDGKLLACGSGSSVLLLDAATGHVTRTLRPATASSSPVTGVHFSPDGRWFVSVGQDKQIVVWDADTNTRIYPTLSAEGISNITISAHADLIAAMQVPDGKNDKLCQYIRVWNRAAGTNFLLSTGVSTPANLFTQDPNRGMVRALAFSPDGKTLVSVDLSNQIKLWDMTAARPKTRPRCIRLPWNASVETRKRSALTLTFVDEERVALAGIDATIQLWNVRTGKRERSLTERYDTYRQNYASSQPFSALACGRDRDTLVCARNIWWQDANKVELWSLKQNKPIGALNSSLVSTEDVAFHPKKRTVLVTGGSSLRVWDFSKRIKPFALAGSSPITFTPDGKLVSINERHDGLTLWDVETLTGTGGNKMRSAGHVLTYTLSPDGQCLAAAVENQGHNEVVIWEVKTGVTLLTLRDLPFAPQTMAFSRDHHLLSTIASGRQKQAIIWDVSRPGEMGGERQVLKLTSDKSVRADAIAFHPRRDLMACEIDGRLTIYSIELPAADQPIRLTQRTEVSRGVSPVFVPDQDWLATELNGDIFLTDVVSGEQVGPSILQAGHAPKFTQVGKTLLLVCRSQDGKEWHIYDAAHALVPLREPSGGLKNLTYSADGRLAASVSGSAETVLWDTMKGNPIVTLMSVGEEGYIARMPAVDNFYTASPGALKQLRVRQQAELLRFEQFDLKLNRPDKLLQSLGCAPESVVEAQHRIYLRRLAKHHTTEEQLTGDSSADAPTVTPLKLDSSSTERVIRFPVEAASAKSPLSSLNVYVNDVPIYGSAGLSLEALNTQTLHNKMVEVTLSNGENWIEVEVTNAANATSSRNSVLVRYTGKPATPHTWAILIGVSQYRLLDSLSMAAKDAQDLGRFLDPSGHNPRIKVLPDRRATRSQILNLKDFFKKSQPDDTVILAVAGHGVRDQHSRSNDYYFAANDTDPNHLKTTGLSYGDLESLLDNIPARNKLLLLDTCFSGEEEPDIAPIPSPAQTTSAKNGLVAGGQGAGHSAAPISDPRRSTPSGDSAKSALAAGNATTNNAKGVKLGLGRGLRRSTDTNPIRADDQDLIVEDLVDLRRGTGAVVIAAARALQEAKEGERGSKVQNGLFTFAVLKGWRDGEAAPKGTREVRVSWLREYVEHKVVALSGGVQQPTKVRENLTNDFVLPTGSAP